MKLHTNAALTQKQRQEIKRLYQSGNYTYPALAKQFATTRQTIAKWVKRETTTDGSCAPKQHGRRRVTEAYRQAVIAYRQAHATHGPVRIQAEPEPTHGHFAFSTVRLIIKQAALSQAPKPKVTQSKAIPVGRHRTQMDVQQLPAIEGSSGFEYKISVIHLSTRIKYSEIHAKPPFLSPSLTTP